MALLDVRDLVVKHTGRVDLVNEDGSDNGLNVLINAAQDMLERNLAHPKLERRHVATLAANGYKVDLPRCISIREVWIMGSISGTVSRRQLDIKSYNWMRGNYANAYSAITAATPVYCCPSINAVDDSLHAADSIFGASPTITVDVEGLTKEDYEYAGLLIMPPADVSYTVTVIGDFLSKKLTLDTDINYWTERNPLVLAMATALAMEGLLRNLAGIKAWEAALQPHLDGLDKDSVAMEADHTNLMEG
jgi:hypothetical protein